MNRSDKILPLWNENSRKYFLQYKLQPAGFFRDREIKYVCFDTKLEALKYMKLAKQANSMIQIISKKPKMANYIHIKEEKNEQH